MDREEKEARRMDRHERKEERQSSLRDRARKRAEQRENQGGGGKYNLPEGMQFFSPKKHASLDIIPYVVSVENHPEGVPKGELWYQRTIFVHYGVGAEDKSYLCLKTVKKKCPICERHAQLVKDPDADEEMVKGLKAKERELFNVYDRDDSDKGVQFWDISNFNFGARLEEEVRDGRPEWGAFAEPVDGFTLKVRFSEEQIGKNKFMKASRIDFEARKSIDKKLLSQALDLDKILKVLPYEQLETIFLGVEGENGEGENQEEERHPESRRPSAETEEAPSERRDRSKPERKQRPELVEEATHSSSRRERPGAVDKSALECPAGGIFGKDCDELKACKDCEIWDQCVEEQERLNAHA